MRIKTISLSWFRGAGDRAILNTDLKNVVVYGCNGSGKSSFSDAIEYVVTKGKIRHLMHEYSGSRQEKGIINTHAPTGMNPTTCITFEGDVSVDVRIALDGTPSFGGNPEDLVDTIQAWELERLILRQDEVAAFVEKTKGVKYSVLLPLLGLEHLEQAAENIINLSQSIKEITELQTKAANLNALKQQANKYFPDLSEGIVLKTLQSIAKDYVKGKTPTKLPLLADTLSESIKERIDSLTPEITRHALLMKVNEEDLPAKLQAMIEAEEKILRKIDTLLDSHIEILQQASKYIDKLGGDKTEVECPACGRMIRTDEFDKHVQSELQALKDLCSDRNIAIKARQVLRSSVRQVLAFTKDDSISSWLDLEKQKELKEALGEVSETDEKEWQGAYSTEDKSKLYKAIRVIVQHVKTAVATVPPSNQKLIDDSKLVEASKIVPSISVLEEKVAMIYGIIQALNSSESAIRNSIRSRTNKIIESISGNIQALWSKLHPDEPIEDIKLYLPEDADKAIDISLKFYGVEQPSPRLTLSEGHRNSLGLCIFLALACLEDKEDRPIFLDDIVSSLDREHRGRIRKILIEDLASRQVLLFTHDREWLQELRSMLPPDKWKFMTLKPWESPEKGLQWSDSTDTFDDARALAHANPKEAGNCVRAIMDTYLAIATEKLHVMMPYARGDRNDRRTCINFLERIIAEAKTRLRKKDGDSWKEYTEPIEDWRKAHALLLAWADRASHTGSLVPSEVEELIQVCEKALNYFKCNDCDNYVWIAEVPSRKRLQCNCGKIGWML